MADQTAFVLECIKHIRSLYSSATSKPKAVVMVGHSMVNKDLFSGGPHCHGNTLDNAGCQGATTVMENLEEIWIIGSHGKLHNLYIPVKWKSH